MYLEKILNYFSGEELNDCKLFDDYSILHFMIYHICDISLNSFEIILCHGASANKRNCYGNTPMHLYLGIAAYECNVEIINLFMKHGANFNILNYCELTVLDMYTYLEDKFSENYKSIIMVLIDFGAKINNPNKNNSNTMNFIESYQCESIKPVIKMK